MDSLTELKKLYAKAKKDGKESFMFQGKEILTSYAHYLIQYLELSNQLYSHFKI